MPPVNRPRLLVLVALAAGCVGRGAPTATPPDAPDADSLARCKVQASATRPLITEWPATERSRLESRASTSLVVVSYSGCDMRVLDECRARGSYAFRATSVAVDGFTVADEDELWAKLPLGAAALEGELRRSGELALRYVVVGQREAVALDEGEVQLDGACDDATHVVAGYAVGAFELSSHAASEAAAGVDVLGTGAGVAGKSEKRVVRSGGDPQECTKLGTGRAGATAPPEACSAPIQLFLAPLPPSAIDPRPDSAAVARASAPSASPPAEEEAAPESAAPAGDGSPSELGEAEGEIPNLFPDELGFDVGALAIVGPEIAEDNVGCVNTYDQRAMLGGRGGATYRLSRRWSALAAIELGGEPDHGHDPFWGAMLGARARLSKVVDANLALGANVLPWDTCASLSPGGEGDRPLPVGFFELGLRVNVLRPSARVSLWAMAVGRATLGLEEITNDLSSGSGSGERVTVASDLGFTGGGLLGVTF